MNTIEFHPEALAELLHAKRWYNTQSNGLGSEFISEIENALKYIQEKPGAWGPFTEKGRRFLIHRFPFAIIYQINNDKLRILAVMHLRRKPGYWMKRK